MVPRNRSSRRTKFPCGLKSSRNGQITVLTRAEATDPHRRSHAVWAYSIAQIRLLRVLQEGEFQRVGGSASIRVDVRVISATNQNLEDLVQKGHFRQDLYYRLNVFPVRIPPLRERSDDIPLLVSQLVEACNRKMNRRFSGVSPEAVVLLMAYRWPGNVRELENVIQRMMVVAESDGLELQDLPVGIRGSENAPRERTKDLKQIARGSAGRVGLTLFLALLGAASGMLIAPLNALVQWHSPDDRRGALIALSNTFVFGGILVGSLSAKILSEAGLPSAGILLAASAATAAGTVWALQLLPDAFLRLRRSPHDPAGSPRCGPVPG